MGDVTSKSFVNNTEQALYFNIHTFMGYWMDHGACVHAYICVFVRGCGCMYLNTNSMQTLLTSLHHRTHIHHTHLNGKTIDLGQAWQSFNCLLKLWLYWVAGVASPFHTINLLEGFFVLRSCSHNSDLNVFLGTFFAAVIWQTVGCIGSFLRKMLSSVH